jgi:hypothetical protein
VISDALVDKVSINCPSATTLTRLELTMPGWSAHVNGMAMTISSTDGLTQTVAVPAGTSTITFTYLPPHEEVAMIVSALALVAIASTWRPRRRRRNVTRGGSDASLEGVSEPGDLLDVDSGVTGESAATVTRRDA